MRKQRGVTMIGWIFLLIPMVIVLYGLVRVGPVYYGHYKLMQALKGTANNLKSEENLSPQAVRNALGLRFDTDYVDVLAPKEIDVAKAEEGWTMTADYEQEVALFGNLNLLLKFDDTVVIN